jgi:hypothetical protein
MKTPKCKECKGTGTVHIDIPNAIFQNGAPKIFDLPCWICGAANFKGMNKDQVSWYLKLHKAFDVIKGKSLRAGECIAPQSWLTMKNAINLACSRLKIDHQPISYPKAIYGETSAFMHLREEFREFERRLEAIPNAVAGN